MQIYRYLIRLEQLRDYSEVQFTAQYSARRSSHREDLQILPRLSDYEPSSIIMRKWVSNEDLYKTPSKISLTLLSCHACRVGYRSLNSQFQERFIGQLRTKQKARKNSSNSKLLETNDSRKRNKLPKVISWLRLKEIGEVRSNGGNQENQWVFPRFD